MEMLLVQLIIVLIIGCITAAIARSKGRNAVGWFFVGFFAGLIGIIIVLCLPNLKEQRARQAYADRERRLLRERLKQEQIKNETYRQYSAGRLDAHDEVLGVNTRLQPELAAPAPQAAIGHEGPAAPLSSSPTQEIWYYEMDGQTHGPVSETSLKVLMQSTGSRVSGATLVWAEGMVDWAPAHEVPALRLGAGP